LWFGHTEQLLGMLKGNFHSVQRMLIPLHKQHTVQFSKENSGLFEANLETFLLRVTTGDET
jgi:hypothetical protein